MPIRYRSAWSCATFAPPLRCLRRGGPFPSTPPPVSTSRSRPYRGKSRRWSGNGEVELFERLPRSVRLSSAGQAFLEDARRIDRRDAERRPSARAARARGQIGAPAPCLQRGGFGACDCHRSNTKLAYIRAPRGTEPRAYGVVAAARRVPQTRSMQGSFSARPAARRISRSRTWTSSMSSRRCRNRTRSQPRTGSTSPTEEPPLISSPAASTPTTTTA